MIDVLPGIQQRQAAHSCDASTVKLTGSVSGSMAAGAERCTKSNIDLNAT